MTSEQSTSVPARGRPRKGLYALLTIGFGLACALFFRASYRDAKEVAVAMLRDEQRIHARQAALGIEDFFATWTSILSALSRMEGVVRHDDSGRHDMQLLFEAHREQIRSLIRVDEKGVIVASFPFGGSEGSDISSQKHLREILRDHRPVVSDVFRAVQGFDAVALHVPVFEGEAFHGTIGVTFNFESLAHRYFDVIRIGKSGAAWVVSRDGTLLYNPVAGLAGKPVAATFKGSGSINDLFASMLLGREGFTTYAADRIGDRPVAPGTRYAVYMPIQIGNTFWSVAVTSSEEELLASLNSFRNRLALMVGLVFVGGVLLSFAVARAWLVIREAEERRKADEALRESEARHRKILHTAMFGFWIVDLEGRLLEVNEAYGRMSGYGTGELIGMRTSELEDAGTAEGMSAHLQEILSGGESRFQTRHRRKDGSFFDVDVSTQYQPEQGGRVVAFLRDITARKRAEEVREAAYRISAAAESTGSLGEFFELAHEIVSTLVPAKNFYIALLDREACTLDFPYFVDEVDPRPAPRPLGRGLTEYVIRTGEPLLATPELFADLVERGEVEPLGAPSVDWLGAPLNVSGSTIGAVVVQTYTEGVRFTVSDREFLSFITSQLAMLVERKRTEAEVRQVLARNRELIEELDQRVKERTAQLTEANVELEAYSYSVAHELRSPLRAIDGFSARIARGYDERLDEEGRRLLGQVRRNAQRMGQLIDDLLALSNVGRTGLTFRAVEMSKAANEAFAHVLPDPASATRISLSVGELPEAWGDAALLRQVWVNLLSNAVKFSAGREIPEIRVAGSVEGGETVYRVSDNGVGFDEKYVEKLFGVFLRLHSMAEFEGTGVGLALVKRIVRRHGGRVWAEGAVGRGATFSFSLPARQAREGASTPEPAPSA